MYVPKNQRNATNSYNARYWSHQFRHNIGRGGPCCSNCTYAPHTIKLFTRLAHNFNTHAIINQLTRMSLLSTQVNSIHFMAKRRWLCVFWQHLHITTTSLLAKNARPQTKMDNQLMESYNNIAHWSGSLTAFSVTLRSGSMPLTVTAIIRFLSVGCLVCHSMTQWCFYTAAV